MAFDNPFQAEGEWLKGNLHTHTTLSDGRLPPQERVAQYEARGYDFLALTDHYQLADPEALSTNGLIVIRGIEIGAEQPLGGQNAHVVGLDVPADFQTPTQHVQTVIDAINAAGGKAIICHPYWCGHSIKHLELFTDFLGIEIFNTTCLRGIGKGASVVQWDDLLAQGKAVLGFAVDDAHGETRDAFQGWIVARSSERSTEAVMDAIARGRFYSSCGPTFGAVELDGDRIFVRTSPVASISFILRGPHGRHIFNEDGAPVTEAEFVLQRAERYLRVECTDLSGRCAWTNPLVLNPDAPDPDAG
jgi:hypothetical protein